MKCTKKDVENNRSFNQDVIDNIISLGALKNEKYPDGLHYAINTKAGILTIALHDDIEKGDWHPDGGIIYSVYCCFDDVARAKKLCTETGNLARLNSWSGKFNFHSTSYFMQNQFNETLKQLI